MRLETLSRKRHLAYYPKTSERSPRSQPWAVAWFSCELVVLNLFGVLDVAFEALEEV
jgi:hypothetical protein